MTFAVILPRGYAARNVTIQVVRANHLWRIIAEDRNGTRFPTMLDGETTGTFKTKRDALAVLEPIAIDNPLWVEPLKIGLHDDRCAIWQGHRCNCPSAAFR